MLKTGFYGGVALAVILGGRTGLRADRTGGRASRG